MEKLDVHYVRYMDDWCILAKTRRKLKRAIKVMNQVLAKLKLSKHPDKTQMGKIAKGFDFLGFHFTKESLTVAKQSLVNAAANLARLLEQGAPLKRIEQYWRRWLGWVQGHEPQLNHQPLLWDKLIGFTLPLITNDYGASAAFTRLHNLSSSTIHNA